MNKILVITNCRQCSHFENNMYHGLCCWDEKVCKPHEDGRIPKKIKTKTEEEYLRPTIPKWCPLEDEK